MAEKIAVVGPRQGADLEAVESFVRALHSQSPEAILVSGGAEGVDEKSETTWVSLGGLVWSYRIEKRGEDQWVCVRWELGPEPKKYELLGEPSWADPISALFYRSMLVTEVADKICAFGGISRMRGTEFTVWVGKEAEQKPTYVWRDGEWESFNT